MPASRDFRRLLLGAAFGICAFFITLSAALAGAPLPESINLPPPSSVIDGDIIGPKGPLKNPVSGGWGFTSSDPCIINALSKSPSLLTNLRIFAVQTAVAKARIEMELIIQYGHTVEIISIGRIGNIFYKGEGGKLLEMVRYNVVTAPDSAVSSYGDNPPAPLNAQDSSTYSKAVREVWFDITTPFVQNSIILAGKWNSGLLAGASAGKPVKLPEEAQISPYLLISPSAAVDNATVKGGWGYSQNDPCVLSGVPNAPMLQNQLIQMRNNLEFAGTSPSGNILTPVSQSVTSSSKVTANGKNLEKVSYTVYTVEANLLYKINKNPKEGQSRDDINKEIANAAKPQERVFWFAF